MPRSDIGQLITFGVEVDQDQRFQRWVWVDVKIGDTVQKIASRRGHPEDARRIADENNIRNARKVLRQAKAAGFGQPIFSGRTQIKVPGELKGAGFNVLAGDQPPRIVGGYAKLGILDRPELVGITTFEGYDPITMEVPIRFLGNPGGDGSNVERDIAFLERLAGRGDFAGAGQGPPPVIRLSTTGPRGGVVPLIPDNYQWSKQNPTAPLWRVSEIEWDAEPRRLDNGNRIDQLATVLVQQHTRINLAVRSVSSRSKTKKKKR
jgi:hypothetical protein